MKTSELAGDLLALWVARALGMDVRGNDMGYWVIRQSNGQPFEGYLGEEAGGLTPRFSPHTDWAQGGPIIDREHIQLEPLLATVWVAHCPTGGRYLASADGQTALIAAMRAFVASKFGAEVPDQPTP